MIGGVGDKQYYNDVWLLDTITCLWSQLDIHGQQPQGRFSHTAIVTNSDIVIFGGCGEDERPLNQLLVLPLGSDHPNDRYNCSCTLFGSDQFNPEKRHFLHEHQTDMRQLPFPSDPMHTKRRRMSNAKACELIESEPEEHSLSLSQHSSPSHSDQERTVVKKPFNSVPQVLPLFKNQSKVLGNCKKIPGTQSNPIMILGRNPEELNFIEEQSNHQKHHHQSGHESRTEHRNFEPLRVQNLIGAEVHGKVDGAFDSGYLMTATVNGRIFRGVLFPPGPEVVSRGTFRRRSPTNHMAPRNQHINRAFIKHANHAPEASHHGYVQDPRVHRPSPSVRSVPTLSLGREQSKVQNELHGVVLTLGAPDTGHSVS